MLTTRFPFGSDSLPEVLENVLHGSPTPVRAVAPQVSASVEALCMKCLARDPAERFPGPGELMQAISSVMADLGP